MNKNSDVTILQLDEDGNLCDVNASQEEKSQAIQAQRYGNSEIFAGGGGILRYVDSLKPAFLFRSITATTIKELVTQAVSTGLTLTWVSIPGADLRGIDLSGLVMKEADFRNVNFRGANLRSATLIGADLSGSNLTNTNLSNVKAYKANFNNALMNGTLVYESNFAIATFEGVDVSTVKPSVTKMPDNTLRHKYSLFIPDPTNP